MTFNVVVTRNAKADLQHYYERAAKFAPSTAAHWLNRFESALASLSKNPHRCSIAAENNAVDPEIRQLIYGKRTSAYRVLFTIAGIEVQVLHIRRAAMDIARPDELFE